MWHGTAWRGWAWPGIPFLYRRPAKRLARKDSPMSTAKGFRCPTCMAVRVHEIRTIRESGRVTRIAVCTTCSGVTPIAIADRPGICCPRCLDIRFTGPLYTRQRPGKVVRVKKCRGCGHKIRTQETVVSYAC